MPDTATAVALDQYKATVDSAFDLLVTALTAPPPPAAVPPLIGATSVGNSEPTFADLANTLGPLDLHYTFQPGFKADFSTWAGSGCTPDHLPLASTKWATPTAHNFVTLVNSIPQDGLTRRIIMYQEPEDNLSAADFQRVVSYFRDAIDASGRTDILLCVNVQCGWNFTKNSAHNASGPYMQHADVVGWSWWVRGDKNDLPYLEAAMDLTARTGSAFAISSLIIQGAYNAAGVASSLSACADALSEYPGKVDHICAYMGNGPVALADANVGATLRSFLDRCREGF